MNSKTRASFGPLALSRRALLRAGMSYSAASAIGCGALVTSAHAEAFPSKLVKIVVPFPPGGANDTIARILALQLSTQTGQSFIIENRAGANSVIGATHVRDAPPDGYTVLFNASLQVVNPYLLTTPTYDPQKDFVGITQIGNLPQLVVVNAQSPYRSVQDLVSDAWKRPGRVTWAISSYATAGHLAAELIKLEAKADMPIIPYKGGAPALNDLMGGHVSGMVEPMASALPHVQSGRLRAIAVTTAKRAPELPDVPTVGEGEFPGFDMPTWYGMWAPAGTKAPIVQALAVEVRKAMQAPAVIERLKAMSCQIVASSPEDFATFTALEIAKYRSLVGKAKIKVES
jgi:tripartite-type tricarboxylate transporter receptor subunit TctC